jgi:hypothetical protein
VCPDREKPNSDPHDRRDNYSNVNQIQKVGSNMYISTLEGCSEAEMGQKS